MNDVLLDGKTLLVQRHDDTGWVFIHWKSNDLGHIPISFARELKEAERIIRDDGYPGWFCNSEPEHKKMHKIIERKGGIKVAEDDGFFWFRKSFKG